MCSEGGGFEVFLVGSCSAHFPRQVIPHGSLDIPELPLVLQLKSLCHLILPSALS